MACESQHREGLKMSSQEREEIRLEIIRLVIRNEQRIEAAGKEAAKDLSAGLQPVLSRFNRNRAADLARRMDLARRIACRRAEAEAAAE